MNRRALWLFLGLGLVWGIPYLLIKVAVGELSPSTLVLARTGLAALLLLPVALARGVVRPVLRRWRWVLALSVTELAVPWLFLGRAEQHLPSSTTGLLIAAVPALSTLLALVSGRGERPGTTGWLGLLLGFAGVAALVGVDVGGSDLASVAEVGVAAVGYAIGPAIMDRRLGDLSGLGVVSVALTITALGYLPVVLIGGGVPATLPAAKVLASVLVLAVLCTAAAFLMLFALISQIGPVRATSITYLNPVVAVAAGALVLNERVTVWTLTGFVLVLTGTWLSTRPRPAPEDHRLWRENGGSVTDSGTQAAIMRVGG